MRYTLLLLILCLHACLLFAQPDGQTIHIQDHSDHTQIKMGELELKISHQEMRDHHFYKGMEYAEQGLFEEAIQQFNAAFLYAPEDPELLYNRGLCHFFNQQYQAAKLDFDLSLNFNPGDSNVVSQRAITKSRLGDAEGCLEDFQQLVEAHPESPKFNFNLAIAYLELNQAIQACSLLDKAAKLGYPNVADIRARFCPDQELKEAEAWP
jgi:tetratricopeptide (TPR) repeat protein